MFESQGSADLMQDVLKVADTSVSRETHEKLKVFCELLLKWNRAINLIGPTTKENVWKRHIEDSAQLFHLSLHPEGLWLDLGSGGGLPGIVITILRRDMFSEVASVLIESDERKAVFLETAARTLNLNVTVLNTRIEAASSQMADTISARALAPLEKLLPLALRHAADTCTLIFPKGAGYLSEIENSRCHGYPEPDIIKSRTDQNSVVLKYQITGGRFE